MSSFQNTKEIENPTVKSKVIATRSVLMCFYGFLDILTVLTLILTHEKLLERELNNICNGIGPNMFRRSNQN